jgi:hypothetical protein
MHEQSLNHNKSASTERFSLTPSVEILERNLNAIGFRSPNAARAIMNAQPRTDIEFIKADDGELAAKLDGRAMCSLRRPIDEAKTWSKQHDPKDNGFFGIIGFGLGHHIRAMHEAHQKHSVLVCFEPDLSLLRSVFEHIDHSDWIRESHLLMVTDGADTAGLSNLISSAVAFISTGVELVIHPASKLRLQQQGSEFSASFIQIVKAMRTHMVTVLSHSGVTLRNILMNTRHYASNPGIEPLKDSCKGKTAILIAAGPSLQRNLALLEDPSIRDRSVIIAVQTMLKPLLERGIKPHFVTALDHHEISKRFYEGLTPEDVQGVRLVAEPKANAAIFETFPGEILCTGEPQLDALLGEELGKPMGKLPAGATVAHLNYYLARYLGCKNFVMIGQDLGFTDGQYYSASASIHRVWSGELSEHRTLEMFEWERIGRMKSLLRPKTDTNGRSIYTDEQMSTYIAQFEGDFLQDKENDETLRIINATEGGVHIKHTEVMTLKDAIDQFVGDDRIQIPETINDHHNDEQREIKLRSRIDHVHRQLTSIERHSTKVIELIDKALEHDDDPKKVDRIIAQIYALRDDVTASEPGYGLVNFINQKGSLDRFKVDRQIALLDDLTPTEHQRKQLERDANNVRWVEYSAKEVATLIRRVLDVIDGNAQPMTRDEFADEEPSTTTTTSSSGRRVEAVIFADPDLGPLGTPRKLEQPIFQDLNALELTVKRLGQCTALDGITIITPDPQRIEAMQLNHQLPVRIIGADPETLRSRTESIGKARYASSECWRGSIGSLGCYDEGLEPNALLSAMEEHKIDAAAIVGPDWAMVDPTLVDRIVKRHRADPDQARIPFSQAVPGLGCVVIDRDAVGSLAQAAQNASVNGSIGAMLSYIPIAPQGDPIASPLCVGVDLSLRDAGVRVVADSTIRVQSMAAAYRGLGDYAMSADATVLLKAYKSELDQRAARAPSRIQLELTSHSDLEGHWKSLVGNHTSTTMNHQDPIKLISEARVLRDDCSVLISGRGDPLNHPDAIQIISEINQLGIVSIELRTPMLNEKPVAEQLVRSGIDVLSIDVLANTPAVYQTMTGSHGFDDLLDTMQTMFNERPSSGLPTPWIVPRITRCDASYQDIEGFYDRWLSVCGCAIIDPNPNTKTNDRIQPLPIPEPRASQLENATLRIQADGQVVDHLGQPVPNTNAIELGIEQSYQNLLAYKSSQPRQDIEPKANPMAVQA